MKTVLKEKALKVSLALIALGLLIGCGSSKSSEGFGSADSSSTTTVSTEKPALAICSQGTGDAGDFQVNLMQYFDSSNKAVPDYLRLQIKISPSGWQSGNWDLAIQKWAAAPDNSTNLDSTDLFYRFEKKVSTGFQLISNTSYKWFNWNEITQMAQFAGLSAGSPQSFFNQVTLLVNTKDTTNSFQVLRVVLRDPTSGSVVRRVDVLMPSFQADPAAYNADNRHPVTLQVLHPLKDRLGQSWSQAQYYEFTRAFCF